MTDLPPPPQPPRPSRSSGAAVPPDEKEARRRDKELRRLDAEKGVLEPAFRYRAIQNAVEMTQDLIEMADRKARFALVIISVLNAVALVVAVRGGESLIPATGAWGKLVMFEVVVYVAVTVYYIFQAIEALRPRGTKPATDALPSSVLPGMSMRVLFHADVVRRPRDEYVRLWDELRMDNLNTELAEQLHIVSTINEDKYAALAKLYRGVSTMTALLTLTLLTIALSNLLQ